jgi:hypothetical protein
LRALAATNQPVIYISSTMALMSKMCDMALL